MLLEHKLPGIATVQHIGRFHRRDAHDLVPHLGEGHSVPVGENKIVQRLNLRDTDPRRPVLGLRRQRGVRFVQDVFIRNGLPVDHQRRSELEGIDHLFPVDFFLVRVGQLRPALQDVEIPVLVNQQHVQVVHHRIPVHDTLAQAVFVRFLPVIGIAEIPIYSFYKFINIKIIKLNNLKNNN